MHEYIAYGLAIHSEIPLPELTPRPSARPDVRVHLGGVPEALDAPLARRALWTARPGEWLLEFEGVGRYYVRDGCEIRVEPEGDEADVRAFLFSSTWGALLHQRGLLVLHASAVHTPAGAVAVAGKSGAGKSTTLARLLERGHILLADDKVAVIQEDGRPMVVPGYPTVRLWRDARERMGAPADGLPRLRADLEKYLFRADEIRAEPSPLRALFCLDARSVSEVQVERMEGVEAFQAVYRSTYRNRLVAGFGMREAHFRRVSALAAVVPVFQVARPHGEDTVGALVEAVEAAVGLP